MEAPHIVACRALIMLASLVVLPLVALFGLPVDQNVLDLIPEQYRSLLTRAAPAPVASIPEVEIPGETLRYQAAPTLPAQLHPAQTPTANNPNLAVSYDAATPGQASPFESNSVAPAPIQTTQLQTTPAAMPRLTPVSMGGGSPETGAPAAIGTRLRELGAIRYALEPWGTSGKLFRFRAKVSLGPDLHAHRHFEAVHVDKLAAMQQVLAQVEDWRAKR